ncbi:MAG: hypothetical protein V4692_13025, partial [Bdellovibrionota bacterium]
FTSDANYDETRGSFSRLSNGRSLTVFETRPKIRYAFTHAVSAFAGTSFAQSKAVDFTNERSNSNVNEVFGGIDFQMNRRWWRVIPEIEFSYPVESSVFGQTLPMTSEGVWYVRAGVFLFKPYKRVRFETYLGVHYPGEGLAKRFQYSATTELALIRGFSLGGGISGFETIVTDDKLKSDRINAAITANAGSQRYWAYDPALIEAKAWLGFRADRAFTFRLGYAKTINGVRTAEGSTILLSIAYNSPGDKERGRAIRSGFDIEEEPDVETEVSNTDGEFRAEPEVVDPELFEQEQARKKSKRAPVRKSPESLDSTEKMLESRQ